MNTNIEEISIGMVIMQFLVLLLIILLFYLSYLAIKLYRKITKYIDLRTKYLDKD